MTVSALTRPGERDRLIVKLGQIDWAFCAAICAIAFAGAAMLYSVAGGAWSPWAAQHLIRFGFWFVVMIALAMVDLQIWFALAYPVYAIGLVLLVAVAAHGHSALGAQRWINIGPIHQFQPSEVMKIGLVLALARFYHSLSARSAQLSWWLLIPAALIGMPVALVMKQPDLGTALLIAAIGLSMMILAGLSLRLVIAGALLVGVAAPLAVKFVLKPYQLTRLLTFINPEADKSGAGYHIMQSKIALGSGGLLGKGFGLGSQSQLNFLPEKQTDFIFTMLGEEFGFVGGVAVLGLLALIVLGAMGIALRCRHQYGRLLALGIGMNFFMYVFVNVAMVMGAIPVGGVPLPLVSHGGSAMIMVMVGFGLLMSVHVHRDVEFGEGRDNP